MFASGLASINKTNSATKLAEDATQIYGKWGKPTSSTLRKQHYWAQLKFR